MELIPLTRMPKVGELVYFVQKDKDGSDLPPMVYRILSLAEVHERRAEHMANPRVSNFVDKEYDAEDALRYFIDTNNPDAKVDCAIFRFKESGKVVYNSLFKVDANA